MLSQASDPLARFSPAAIHDTVAAIVRQDVYQERLSRSLAERFAAWLWEQFRALFEAVAGTPGARNVALVFAALLVITIVLRILYSARLERRSAPHIASSRALGAHSLPTLFEARRLADAARYNEAIHVLYAAVVAALAQHRAVLPHRAKTSGDFARELRARAHPSYESFRSFVRRFDRLFYGYDSCDAAAFDALFVDAEQVVRSAGLLAAA